MEDKCRDTDDDGLLIMKMNPFILRGAALFETRGVIDEGGVVNGSLPGRHVPGTKKAPGGGLFCGLCVLPEEPGEEVEAIAP